MTKYGAKPEQTSKTAEGRPGLYNPDKQVAPQPKPKEKPNDGLSGSHQLTR
jgi:hypothetical protein